MNDFEVQDLSPHDDEAGKVLGGYLAKVTAQSPLTLGTGQIVHVDFGNGPLVGGHANADL